ncbi:hypothetical protein NG800_008130 [Epilithonimonas ginsengisoli]|jgi:hypothetical protein|uniref:Exo-alpha-sialidase n=1 Tax=Epilithonimonas ginsengisoli TaxID=1245592 RepID=A0ABU4JGQ6_9FLAO|nr:MULTISPECIES: hypothetical protein [Chryseobacterium group]MBV6878794.1 hypothetical protein [Epilithonimonas sp. FP105]MDW8548875.1 hypothetical protein [Epilithonimonas ginsengisoli]OAH72350.1 hypothetical protein AXA65_10440 [Chryseobacterium sp. FP211-J200]
MTTITSMGIKLIRISRTNPIIIEISDNAGISWNVRYSGSQEVGEFYALTRRGEIIFALTSTGTFRSVDAGAYWMKTS